MYVCSDAAWETEPNAFAELLERPDKCEAEKCVCPDGRDHEDTQYQMIRCDTCGSHCVHNKCMLTKAAVFTCVECILPVGANASGIKVTARSSSSIATDDSSDTEVDVELETPISKLSNPNVTEDDLSDDESNIPLSLFRANALHSQNDGIIIRKIDESKHPDLIASQSIDADKSLVDNRNNSITSDVEFVETKEEILCISDDESENPSTLPKVDLNQSTTSKKRTLDDAQSPLINPPSKKIRRALATMRNQSKITSYFNILCVPKKEKDAGGSLRLKKQQSVTKLANI